MGFYGRIIIGTRKLNLNFIVQSTSFLSSLFFFHIFFGERRGARVSAGVVRWIGVGANLNKSYSLVSAREMHEKMN